MEKENKWKTKKAKVKSETETERLERLVGQWKSNYSTASKKLEIANRKIQMLEKILENLAVKCYRDKTLSQAELSLLVQSFENFEE